MSYLVHYKITIDAPWKLYGEFKTESEALENAKDCLLDGYIVQLEEA